MDVRLILLLQELHNQITCLFSVLSASEESSAVADQQWAVSGGHTYGGKVHPARGSAFCGDLEANFTRINHKRKSFRSFKYRL